jgi:hypothetical protein
MTHPGEITRQAIRTPRAAAVAGIAFAGLLTTAMVLVRLAVPSDPDEAGDWPILNGRWAPPPVRKAQQRRTLRRSGRRLTRWIGSGIGALAEFQALRCRR